MGNVMSFIWNEFYIENKVKNKDCHLTGANIAYTNTDWIKFLLPLSSCFPQFKSQVLIAGNRAVVFSRDASMCLFAEKIQRGYHCYQACHSVWSAWLPSTITNVWETRLSKATGGISPSRPSHPLLPKLRYKD